MARWAQLLSDLIALLVAIVVLGASFFQWWDVTYNGKLRTRRWVKVLLATLIAALVLAGVLRWKAVSLGAL